MNHNVYGNPFIVVVSNLKDIRLLESLKQNILDNGTPLFDFGIVVKTCKDRWAKGFATDVYLNQWHKEINGVGGSGGIAGIAWGMNEEPARGIFLSLTDDFDEIKLRLNGEYYILEKEINNIKTEIGL